MTLDDLAQECYQIAADHGWWEDGNSNLFEKIALMHSELSEALEELRVNSDPTHWYYAAFGNPRKPEGFGVELADTIIRILDTCGRFGIPIGDLVLQKMAYNRTRPYRHGGKSA